MFSRSEAEPKPVGLLKGLRTQLKAHRTPLFAAAIAFFAFVALVPALVATVSFVGLVADTDVLVEETEAALENAPAETRNDSRVTALPPENVRLRNSPSGSMGSGPLRCHHRKTHALTTAAASATITSARSHPAGPRISAIRRWP